MDAIVDLRDIDEGQGEEIIERMKNAPNLQGIRFVKPEENPLRGE